MSKNENPNSNSNLNSSENNSLRNSKYSLNSKSENLNLFSKTSIKLEKNVVIKNEDVTSVIEDVLRKFDEDCRKESDHAGPSSENEQIAVIHPQQMDIISSSSDMFCDTNFTNEHLLQSPNISLPLPYMSSAAFKCFILQNFPSAVSVLRKNSLTWHDAFSPKSSAHKSTNDNSTQFDLPSIQENHYDEEFLQRRRGATTSQEIQITPSLVPPRPILGNPPLQGAPPTYSAVMRIGSADTPRRTFGRRVGSHIEPSPPFISPSPPPSYAEAQGHYYHPIIIDSELIWGPDPMAVVCQRCGTHVTTTTTSQRSNLTHFAALALCLCGCWPCCLLPYCMNSCRNTYHYCPNCNTYLGMYRPW